MTLSQLLLFFLFISVSCLIAFFLRFRKKSFQFNELDNELSNSLSSIQAAENRIKELETLYAPLLELDNEIKKRELTINELKASFEKLDEKYQSALLIYQSLEAEIGIYKETLEINSFGLYKPQYSFDLPEQYLVELEGVYDKQKALIKKNNAAICHAEWTVEGSKAEGRKMTNQYLKLMLLAFNGDSDSITAKVKWNNVVQSRQKISKSFHAINKLGTVNHCEITSEYEFLKFEV